MVHNATLAIRLNLIVYYSLTINSCLIVLMQQEK